MEEKFNLQMEKILAALLSNNSKLDTTISTPYLSPSQNKSSLNFSSGAQLVSTSNKWKQGKKRKNDLSKLMNLMKAFVTFLTSDIVSVMQLKVQPISEFHTELQ
jgi:hypothetical protein